MTLWCWSPESRQLAIRRIDRICRHASPFRRLKGIEWGQPFLTGSSTWESTC